MGWEARLGPVKARSKYGKSSHCGCMGIKWVWRAEAIDKLSCGGAGGGMSRVLAACWLNPLGVAA